MTTNEIRTKFLDFFSSKGHARVASDSLVPKEDPTVLFTTAGMQQFKRQFLGHIEGYTRATTSQKCLRTDDLDEVGKTDFHHTFFEMLGNFSFGDYFKKEAIGWAWEFLTKELKIPAEKLWVSVYKEDSEAKEIWLSNIKIASDRLVELGDKSNFWPANAREAGPNGPCGPCSEIFYDYGINENCTNTDCNPECDCGRFCEIWNLVFTQFNRKDGGVLDPLPSKNIDTGMGLERLVALMQGEKNNFNTDVFEPILKGIEDNIVQGKHELTLRNKRVMADHMRAVVFGINDGVVPSNEGRGYVMKKLIIDITDIALQAGLREPAVYTLVPLVVKAMQEAYPEISEKAKDIAAIIRNIEEAYIKVRRERLPELESKVKAIKTSEEMGNLIFIFKDTYGLTLPTIENVIKALGIDPIVLDKALIHFEELMFKQQEQSRASSKMTGDVFTGMELDLNLPKTKFLGYEQLQSTAVVLGLFIDDQKVEQVESGDKIKIILDQTPFYAESGGQVSDTGILTGKDGVITIESVQKIDDIFIHSGIVKEGTLKVKDALKVQVNETRRLAIMRHHTATHILQVALRTVLGTHVKQQGSLVDESRLRFDFTHHKAVTAQEIQHIEDYVNNAVLSCDKVEKEVLSREEASKSGALAFFAEKYGETVRVISIGDYSKEFCGGTHLDSTGQIGILKITSESAIAQGIRRLEAKAGTCALDEIKAQEQQLEKMAKALKSPQSELFECVAGQVKRIKELEKELENFRFEEVKKSLEGVLKNAKEMDSITLITHCFENMEMGLLRKAADILKKKATSFIIVLGAKTQATSASILVVVSEDVIKKGLKANELVSELAIMIGGSGGGRPQMAQAGSKESGKVISAIAQAQNIIREKLKP
ncbi:Alanyl-tRNA synthetase [hydrothermal vent metagenome]|uniref:Alanine--tRNA ligase n=1 Tax=hydrothermal vent metagenome TaxID=652676 RepID=A0A3B1E020_9ZZZZ